MKNLKQLILGLCGILTVSFFSCQNDEVSESYGTDDSEEVFTVTEVVTTKGGSFISGLGTYKTGDRVTLVAPPYAHITGNSDKGQKIDAPYDVTEKKGNNAEAEITDINANWTVSWIDESPLPTITFDAGPGGTISSPNTVSGKPGSSASGPTATANSGYSFDKWSDGCTTATWSGTIPSTDRTVTAQFAITEKRKFTISVSEIPLKGGNHFTAEYKDDDHLLWTNFNTNGNSGSASVTIIEGGSISISAPNPDNGGRKLVGIFEYGTNHGSSYSTTVTRDIDLTVQYEE